MSKKRTKQDEQLEARGAIQAPACLPWSPDQTPGPGCPGAGDGGLQGPPWPAEAHVHGERGSLYCIVFPTRGRRGVGRPKPGGSLGIRPRRRGGWRWAEAGAAVPGCQEAVAAVAVFLKAGSAETPPLGAGGFSRTPGWAPALRRRRKGALTELPCRTQGVMGRGRTWPWSD